MTNKEKIVYSYDENKVYTGEYKCQIDQLGGGFLIPANCLELAPIIVDDKVPVCENGEWINKTDHRGKLMLNSVGEIEQVKELGDFDNILTKEQVEEFFSGDKTIKLESGIIVISDIEKSTEDKINLLKSQIREASLNLLDGNITEEEHLAIKTDLQSQIRALEN